MIDKTIRVLSLGQIGMMLAFGQAASQPKPLIAEDVFKNVQVLKGIPVNEFMETMGFFSAALSYNCTSCHVEGSLSDWAKFAEDVPTKRMARTMIRMVNAINKENFGGKRMVTCYSCHHGGPEPKTIPSLTEQYSEPQDDPNDVEIVNPAPAGTAEKILDKYVESVGGAQNLAKLTSYSGKGTYEAYFQSKVPVEVFAKAPGRRALIVHGKLGDSSTIFDGRSGWLSGPERPVPVLELPQGQDLDGVRLDADMSIPVNLKQSLSDWRAGFAPASIDDRNMVVIEGMTANRSRVRLYFDKESGLLVRQVRFANTMVGIVPTQVDYSDYRAVGGVKIPFRSVVTWTDGRATIELSEIQPNVPVPETRFSKPVPAPRPGSAAR
jgi:photosynthetic reaction center cytochrome c subunit